MNAPRRFYYILFLVCLCFSCVFSVKYANILPELLDKKKSTTREKNVGVSVFHIPPAVVITNGTITGGLYYHVFKEGFRDWNVTYKLARELQWDDAMDDILTQKTSIAAAPYPLTLISVNSIQDTVFSQILVPSCITFLVPKPVLWDDTYFVVLPIIRHFYVWIFLVLYFLGTLIFRFAFGDKLNKLKSFKNIWNMSIMVLFILFSTYYCACLSSFLTSPPHRKSINSLEDLIENKMQIEMIGMKASGKSMKQTSRVDVNSTEMLIYSLMVPEMSDKKRQYLIKEFKYACITARTMGLITLPDNYNPVILNQLKLFPSGCLTVTHSALLLYKYADPRILKTLNRNIELFRQSGLLDYWVGEVARDKTLKYLTFVEAPQILKDKDKVMNISKLKGAFYIIALGYLLAFVSFLFEIWFKPTRN